MAKELDRNDPCHCGSGRKYKNCCIDKQVSKKMSKMGMIAVAVVVLLGVVIVALSLSGGQPPVDCPPGTTWSDAHQHCH